ncbi:tetratricopeptide repeat protein [candidate division KSB1 bacterium]|nr:tetratricopeptide repeat protein [candidate division KSB1 bacterium]
MRLVRVYAGLGEIAKAETEMNGIEKPKSPLEKSEFQFALAKIWQAKDKTKKAMKAYKKAVAANPYHISARLSLIEILVQSGKMKEAQKFAEQVKQFSLQPGPAFSRRLSEIL